MANRQNLPNGRAMVAPMVGFDPCSLNLNGRNVRVPPNIYAHTRKKESINCEGRNREMVGQNLPFRFKQPSPMVGFSHGGGV